MSETTANSTNRIVTRLSTEAFINADNIQPYDDSVDELPYSQSPNDDSFYLTLFKKYSLNQNQEYLPPESILDIVHGDHVVPLFTRKSISLIHGKQKSLKTTFLAALVAVMIFSGMLFEGIMQAKVRGTILYIDTEQGAGYGAQTMKLILKLAGVDESTNLIYVSLRELSPEDRWKTIDVAIRHTPNLILVIIDGLIDIMEDWTHPTEGHSVITKILRTASIYNIHIAVVLHQNKADKNARSHVGHIASQKCEMEISIERDEKDKVQSIVKCVNSRGLPFEPFFIRWEKGTMPKIVRQNTVHKTEARATNTSKYDEVKVSALSHFQKDIKYRNKDLLTVLKGLGVTDPTAQKRIITYWSDNEIFHKTETKDYLLTQKGALGSLGSNEGANEPDFDN